MSARPSGGVLADESTCFAIGVQFVDYVSEIVGWIALPVVVQDRGHLIPLTGSSFNVARFYAGPVGASIAFVDRTMYPVTGVRGTRYVDEFVRDDRKFLMGIGEVLAASVNAQLGILGGIALIKLCERRRKRPQVTERVRESRASDCQKRYRKRDLDSIHSGGCALLFVVW
ncbi:hypothetical protein [Trinickia mobilis]|uniref:hypothetical protein n=1 Tax=Trinickia mobilis TaxID=2816356 RepID=UPI001A8D42B8|nr:hypothetical protein [Trinickia mobilis]